MSEERVGYKRLTVWKEAHAFTLLIYKATQRFPKSEQYGLTSQLRRAVVSIATNIVEGQARSSRKEFLQFLHIANGSCVEVEYLLELSRDLKYIDEGTYSQLTKKRETVGKLLHGLIRSIKAKRDT